MCIGKDDPSNSIGDVMPNIGSPLHAGYPVLPVDLEILFRCLFLVGFSICIEVFTYIFYAFFLFAPVEETSCTD